MATRSRSRRAGRWVAAAAGWLVLGSAAGAAAQSQPTSASLAVSATVVQTCTVEQVKVPALPGSSSQAEPRSTPGPSYTIRCGKQILTYPAPTGSGATPLSKGAPVTVARTPDGRAYVVQF
jgi:hypothetical protein